MADRLTRRREARQLKSSKPQPDEFYCYDSEGVKVPGRYNSQGQFIVAESHRAQHNVDP